MSSPKPARARLFLARGIAAFTLLALGSGLFAQASPTPTPRGEWKPVPYQDEEFELWAKDLRRAEVLAIGSYPITFLVASLLYDLGRWAVKSINNDSDASLYAPFSATKPALTSDETLGLFLGGLGLSVGIALVDFLIGQDERAREAEKARIERRPSPSPSPEPDYPPISDGLATPAPAPTEAAEASPVSGESE